MQKWTSIWDVTPETAHPRAQQLVPASSIIWKYGDEDSPLGTDVGADTFSDYLAFREVNSAAAVIQFLMEQLAMRRISDADWDLIETDELKKALDKDRDYTVLRRDDIIMGLAFSQLLIDGAIDPLVRGRAIAALRRQSSDVVLQAHGGGGDDARRRQLTDFLRILELT